MFSLLLLFCREGEKASETELDTRQQCDQRSVAETEMKLKNETEVKPQLNESTALALWNDQFTKKLRDFCSFGGLFL